jgi:hypothetical protein
MCEARTKVVDGVVDERGAALVATLVGGDRH